MIFASLILFGLIQPAEPAWDVLFNGKNLDGWVAEGVSVRDEAGSKLPIWSVADGKIVCKGKGFGFLRYDRRELSDFALHVGFRMEPKCNSGIGIRTRVFDPSQSRATRPSLYSYEIQLMDDAGKPPSVHSSGSLYRYVAPARSAIRPAGQWNELDIECVGPRIRVVLNGTAIIDVDQTTIESIRNKPLRGFVCLQNHGGNLEFRDIRVRPLPAPGADAPDRAPGARDTTPSRRSG